MRPRKRIPKRELIPLGTHWTMVQISVNWPEKFSGDNLSYQLGGVLPEFGVGKYERGFETAAYSLKKDGDISAPYESEFGYHIIKRIKRIPTATVADQKTLNDFKERIKGDPRVAVAKNRMMEIILKQTDFKTVDCCRSCFLEFH